MYIQDVPVRPAPDQLDRLRGHLPYALALYRRLQVAAGALDRPDQQPSSASADSPHARIVFVFDEAPENSSSAAFAAAHVDLTQIPETAVWLYASDQDDPAPPDTAGLVIDRGADLVSTWSPDRRRRCCRLVLALLRHVRQLSVLSAPLPADGAERVKVSLHDGVRHLLTAEAGVTAAYWSAFDKWLIREEDVPADADTEEQVLLPGCALRWDRVRRGDVPLVQARTHIPRTEASLLRVPGLGLRSAESGALVAWGFLGLDGSLWTLHCEEAYRGRGLATRLAARLIRQHNRVFSASGGDGDGDGWCMADVSADNAQSQAVCRRLGGRRTWSTSW